MTAHDTKMPMKALKPSWTTDPAMATCAPWSCTWTHCAMENPSDAKTGAHRHGGGDRRLHAQAGERAHRRGWRRPRRAGRGRGGSRSRRSWAAPAVWAAVSDDGLMAPAPQRVTMARHRRSPMTLMSRDRVGPTVRGSHGGLVRLGLAVDVVDEQVDRRRDAVEHGLGIHPEEHDERQSGATTATWRHPRSAISASAGSGSWWNTCW